MTRITFIAAALLLATAAHATTPKPPETPDVEVSAPSSSHSDADAAGVGIGSGEASSDARSASASVASADGGDGGEARAVGVGGKGGMGGEGGKGVGSVDVAGDTNDYDSRAYAINLPGLVAAPAVGGDCRVHTRGIGALGAGVTGGTKFERDCMEHTQCMDRADRLAAWGQLKLAVAELQSCGAAPGPVEATAKAPAAPTWDMSKYVTHEELAEREKRITERTLAK